MSEAAGTARLARYTNTEVVGRGRTHRPAAMLVLNDVWHPWWRATIDGIATEIFRANVIFRAVQVPPGNPPCGSRSSRCAGRGE